MMRPNRTVGIALGLMMLGCGAVSGETLKLTQAVDVKAATSAALSQAAREKYAQGEVYAQQIFQMSLGAEVLGTLVSGSGQLTVEGRENSTCFVALVKPDSKVELVPTVGTGDWEAEACLSIDAVGLVPAQPKTGFARFVVIHSGASPNAETVEAVVLAWDSKSRRLQIDSEASKKVGLAGANTIAAVRKALQ